MLKNTKAYQEHQAYKKKNTKNTKHTRWRTPSIQDGRHVFITTQSMLGLHITMLGGWCNNLSPKELRLVPSRYLWVWGKGEKTGFYWGTRGDIERRRKESYWQISYSTAVQYRPWRGQQTLPAIFQSQTRVSGRNSGSDALKKIYRLFPLKVPLLWLVAGNFQINGTKKSRYRFRHFLLFEKSILSLRKDFSEWFVRFIIVDKR